MSGWLFLWVPLAVACATQLVRRQAARFRAEREFLDGVNAWLADMQAQYPTPERKEIGP